MRLRQLAFMPNCFIKLFVQGHLKHIKPCGPLPLHPSSPRMSLNHSQSPRFCTTPPLHRSLRLRAARLARLASPRKFDEANGVPSCLSSGKRAHNKHLKLQASTSQIGMSAQAPAQPHLHMRDLGKATNQKRSWWCPFNMLNRSKKRPSRFANGAESPHRPNAKTYGKRIPILVHQSANVFR